MTDATLDAALDAHTIDPVSHFCGYQQAIDDATARSPDEVRGIAHGHALAALEAAQALTRSSDEIDEIEMLADMTTSIDRLKASLAAIPAGHPLREEVIEAMIEAHGWLVEAEDRARHLAIAVGDPAVLAAFASGRLVL